MKGEIWRIFLGAMEETDLGDEEDGGRGKIDCKEGKNKPNQKTLKGL